MSRAECRPSGDLGRRCAPAPGFDLLDEQGDPISLSSLRGRPLIVTFIDPLCRDYCPIEAQRLNAVAAAFPAGLEAGDRRGQRQRLRQRPRELGSWTNASGS